jgi:hypothetical protein
LDNDELLDSSENELTEAEEPEPVKKTRTRKIWPHIPLENRVNTRGNTKTSAAFQAQYIDDTTTFRRAFTAARIISSDPQTLKEAMSRPDAKKWEAALIKEYKQIARKNTWKTVRKTEVPKGQKILSGRLVFRTKRDKEGNILKYKVCWVV